MTRSWESVVDRAARTFESLADGTPAADGDADAD